MSSADPSFTDEDFKKVIDHFKAIGFWIKRNFQQEKPRDAGDMIIKPQQKVIDHLWADLTEHIPQAHMQKFRQGFHNRVIKKCAWPQTRAQANAVIVHCAMRAHADAQKTAISESVILNDATFNILS